MPTRSAVKLWSESWVAARRCPTCEVAALRVIDEPARDTACEACGEFYEVKATSNPAAVRAAAGSLAVYEQRFSTEAPNLFLLTYVESNGTLRARHAGVIPRTLVDQDLIQASRPSTLHTGRTVRLCSLRLDQVPVLARLSVVVEGCDVLPGAVAGELQRWHTLRPVSGSRWHREVLRIIGWLNKPQFSRAELLQFLPWLRRCFPEARTPGQTLSRVLQELRDADVLEFVRRGEYRLVGTAYR